MELCVEVALLGAAQAGLLAAPRGARALEERPESPSCGGLATPPLTAPRSALRSTTGSRGGRGRGRGGAAVML